MKPAIYARYSSENQRAASITDQIRNARALAKRDGFGDPLLFCDEAVSGARADRAQYQAMLQAVAQRKINVLIVDDLSRLGRDFVEAESCARQLEFQGVRLIAIADGYDSAIGTSSGRLLNRGAKNLFNEIYLHDLADKTHRGLTGVALAGNSAGGKAYGYFSTPIEIGGEVHGHRKAVNPDQAPWIRFIFDQYADGLSTREIAHRLNQQKVPGPRGAYWAHSAIYGDMKRGLGILNNPLYIGQYIWNRSKWIKDPATGKRKRIERPQSDWITQNVPELQIVPLDVWQAVKDRQARNQAKTKAARQINPAHSGGRGKHKYLLS